MFWMKSSQVEIKLPIFSWTICLGFFHLPNRILLFDLVAISTHRERVDVTKPIAFVSLFIGLIFSHFLLRNCFKIYLKYEEVFCCSSSDIFLWSHWPRYFGILHVFFFNIFLHISIKDIFLCNYDFKVMSYTVIISYEVSNSYEISISYKVNILCIIYDIVYCIASQCKNMYNNSLPVLLCWRQVNTAKS